MHRAKLGEGGDRTIEAVWPLSEALDYYGKREEAAALRKHYVTPLLEADPARWIRPCPNCDKIRQSDKENAS
jgi:hypothetical protein